MTDSEKLTICQSCEKYMPVIHLDVCTASEPAKLLTDILAENCPLGKWNVD